MITLKDLNKLKQDGICFTIHLYDGWYDISPQEVFQYLKNPELFAAKKHHVSLSLWKRWKDHYEDPHCPIILKNRKPCKGYVQRLDLKYFIDKEGEVYCAAHK